MAAAGLTGVATGTKRAGSGARARGVGGTEEQVAQGGKKPGRRAGQKAAGGKVVGGKAIAWGEVLGLARERFGIRRFRPGQKEVLAEVLEGRSALGLMPTGSGKSLTYQLPALILPKPVVVVSPLIALMQDQQERARAAEVAVEKIDSTLTREEARTAKEEIDAGLAQLIYVTPERLGQEAFLRELKDAGGISLLVVDEAHCISQWGHDFRPAYMGIGEARKALGMPPALALTATATTEVVAEILESLYARDAKIINTGTERENLTFSVQPAVNTEAKLSRVTSMLAEEEGTGIIYTASVRSANELHLWLKDRGIAVGRYHGQMRTREREAAQAAFMRGEHKVMIATKAFGLGIDKPDIRFVYHFEFPDSLETYYQEAGRAGRDGLPSRAALLYRLEDKRIQSFFLGGRYPKLADLQAVYEAVGGRVTARATVKEDALEVRETRDPVGDAPVYVSPERLAASQLAQASAIATAEEISVPEITVGVPKDGIVGADCIAERAGLGRRKTQVILHLLQHAGMIRRGRRGYVLSRGGAPSAEAVAELLMAYEERAENDRGRLTEMMHYAETSDCRVQIIRQYFSEEMGAVCGRCDNCVQFHRAGGEAGHVARVMADAGAQARERRAGLDLAAAGGPEETGRDETKEGPGVQRGKVGTGTAVTALAGVLLRKGEGGSGFSRGDVVRHRRFGEGRVKDAHGEVALVHFVGVGDKKVRIGYLEAA